jgi:penicillin amidase
VRWLRWLRWTLLGIVVLALIAFAGAWWALSRSLPAIDGKVTAPGLSAAATIERDASGRPVISAASRADLAWALGFAHGQDRYFQMDLSRRYAAGELSELFGSRAVPQDIRVRRFGFRDAARAVVAAASPGERVIADSYTRGVNAGLESLGARPFEYLVLRASPRAWTPEDSVLVVYSMWWQLQYGPLTAEIDRRRLERAAAGLEDPRASPEAAHELIAFAYAGHSDWDTPNYNEICAAHCGHPVPPYPALLGFAAPAVAGGEEPKAPGSNNWAVAGVHTSSGVALIANDMHLDLGVPPVWYPARLRVNGSPALDLAGVTLPGTPGLVAGSNGHIAWGFTNSYGDFTDARVGPCRDPNYRERRERIVVRDAPDTEVTYLHAGEGVVLDGEEYAADVASGTCFQAAWIATRSEATNFGLLTLERARTVDEALSLAPRVGIPAQNMVVGDAGGRSAWTLAGRVPRTSGAERLFGALEYRDESDHPRIADPPVGRIWTANQRVVEGPLEKVIGDDEVDVGAAGYDIGARARQIRDGLLGLAKPATEADMLRIQLDARAIFLARWRDLALGLLDEEAMRDSPSRREFRKLVSEWQPEAQPGTVGYRLVRELRGEILDNLWNGLVAALLGSKHEMKRPSQFEAAGWRLVNERPIAVPPPGGDWRVFLLERVDAAVARLIAECGSLGSCTYGERKPIAVKHPLSRALPILSGWLDMPTLELPGDHHMPRVQDGNFGASERFAVSPGREDQGYLELPGGPSGHPLSPFYRSGFEDWAAGRPTPFLPGPAVHRLELQPPGSSG